MRRRSNRGRRISGRRKSEASNDDETRCTDEHRNTPCRFGSARLVVRRRTGRRGARPESGAPEHRADSHRRPGVRRRRLLRREGASARRTSTGWRREGTRFTSFYVAQAVCTASRAALLTGCYPNRVGLFGRAQPHEHRRHRTRTRLLLPELCQARGLRHGDLRQVAPGHAAVVLPTRHGFDELLGMPYSNDNGPLHPIDARHAAAAALRRTSKVVETDPDQSQFTRRFTERAVGSSRRNRDRPFFLYVPHVMPHVPIFASEQFRGKSAARPVRRRDRGARLVGRRDPGRAARDTGWTTNTLVIFASDNGPFLSYGDHAGSAGPLREGKLTTFEGGVRVPCIVRWPGSVPAGRVCDELVTTIDLLPTIAKLIGAPSCPNAKIDGVDVFAAAARRDQGAAAARGVLLLLRRRAAGRPQRALEAALAARVPDGGRPTGARRQAGELRATSSPRRSSSRASAASPAGTATGSSRSGCRSSTWRTTSARRAASPRRTPTSSAT